MVNPERPQLSDADPYQLETDGTPNFLDIQFVRDALYAGNLGVNDFDMIISLKGAGQNLRQAKETAQSIKTFIDNPHLSGYYESLAQKWQGQGDYEQLQTAIKEHMLGILEVRSEVLERRKGVFFALSPDGVPDEKPLTPVEAILHPGGELTLDDPTMTIDDLFTDVTVNTKALRNNEKAALATYLRNT